jgi:hypothetical protein
LLGQVVLAGLVEATVLVTTETTLHLELLKQLAEGTAVFLATLRVAEVPEEEAVGLADLLVLELLDKVGMALLTSTKAAAAEVSEVQALDTTAALELTSLDLGA